ncbi:MAG TPA: mercury(II) reductase [Mycobacteriales bacterium]|nr:mercury(II) reductase [Mycobacteriales bacterium]
MSKHPYDLLVVGSGGAAMSAAITARQAGRTVLLVEAKTLGGTCVNAGCVPSKALLRFAAHRAEAAANPFVGAPTSAGPVELGALIGQKDELVGRLRSGKYAAVADAYGFEVRPAAAAFADDGTLAIDGRPLEATNYLLAAGAEPARPDLPGLDRVDYLTSTTAMELLELPDSLVVIGGGYVGMEQAQLFAGLGVRVTLVGRLAPNAEPELREVMRTAFGREGIRVVEHRALAVEAAGNGDGAASQVTVVTDTGLRVAAGRLLLAAGRTPRTAGLNLPAAGVKTDQRGFIVVDAQQRTTNPRVFAAGDVTGGPQYVYVAAAQGRVAALNAFGASDAVDYAGLPAVMFTRPQLASAGLSEEQALAAGYDCECRTLSLADVPRALVNFDTLGAVKLIADGASGRLLGVHAAAEGAGELMLAATYAIRARMTVRDMADTWAPYLTMAESLRLAAKLFAPGERLPTSCCA